MNIIVNNISCNVIYYIGKDVFFMGAEIRKFVGEKIKEYRKDKKMTQKELGGKIGVKHNTISSYENGTNETELDILFEIADVLGKSIDDFFPQKSSGDHLEKALHSSGEKDLSNEDLYLIKQITEKALNLEGKEREQLMNNIKFAVNFYDHSNK